VKIHAAYPYRNSGKDLDEKFDSKNARERLFLSATGSASDPIIELMTPARTIRLIKASSRRESPLGDRGKERGDIQRKRKKEEEEEEEE